jgi:hypothetical protein
MRYEVWAEVQATPGFQEITGTPTVRRLEFSGEDLDSALRAAEEAKGELEVLWATVEVAEGESGEE